jgi:signal transduction histidine kinase
VAHDGETPLAAPSGEVDVAPAATLRDAYREALTRIAGSVAELVELTGDLSVLGEPGDDDRVSTTTARLDAILAPVRERYASNADVAFAVTPAAAAAATVTGDEALLTRAVTILVQYALAHRRTTAGLDPRRAQGIWRGGRVHRRGSSTRRPARSGRTPAGRSDPGGGDRGGAGPVQLRLRIADRTTRCGGSLHAAPADGVVASIRPRCRSRCTAQRRRRVLVGWRAGALPAPSALAPGPVCPTPDEYQEPQHLAGPGPEMLVRAFGS